MVTVVPEVKPATVLVPGSTPVPVVSVVAVGRRLVAVPVMAVLVVTAAGVVRALLALRALASVSIRHGDKLISEPTVVEHLDAKDLATLIQHCQRLINEEATGPELRLFARCMLSRAVQHLCQRAYAAAERGDEAAAEAAIAEALAADPQHRYAQVTRVRLLLKAEKQDEAMQAAGEYGALIDIPVLDVAPIIDGDPTDAGWNGAWKSASFYRACSGGYNPTAPAVIAERLTPPTEARLGHHGGRLYLAMICHADDVTALVVDQTDPADVSRIHHDECVEMIFNPDRGGRRVEQFMLNAGGLIRRLTGNAEKLEDAQPEGVEHAVRVFPDRGYWALEMSLELGRIDDTAGPDSLWAGNLFRCHKDSEYNTRSGSIWPCYGSHPRLDAYPLMRIADRI